MIIKIIIKYNSLCFTGSTCNGLKSPDNLYTKHWFEYVGYSTVLVGDVLGISGIFSLFFKPLNL